LQRNILFYRTRHVSYSPIVKHIASLVALVLVLTSCSGGGGSSGGGTTAPAKTATTPEVTAQTTGGQAATNYSVALNSLTGSTASGTATFTEGSGGVEVALAVQGLPSPNASYLAHIHPGTCADALADEAMGGEEDTSAPGGDSTTGAEEIEEPLQPVVSDSSGNGTSTTVLASKTLDELFSVSAPNYVNVHGTGAGEPPSIACGNLNSRGAA
jgi:hypothetical protein